MAEGEVLAGALAGVDASAVAEFRSVTSCSAEQAKFYLEASNGQFDRAINMFFEQGADRDMLGEPSGDEDLVGASRDARGTQGAGAPRDWQRHGQLLGMLFSVPRLVVQTSFELLFGTIRVTSALVGLAGARFLPGPVLRGIQGSLRSLQQARAADPQTAAHDFVREFSAAYGHRGPQWLEASWAEASRQAHAQFKFLFVYLHSPSHQDTERFCRDTLLDPEIVEYANANFVCWAGSITEPDAFQLSQGLRVCRYPYVALLAFSGSRTRLIAAAEGCFPPDALAPLLRDAQEQQAAHLVAERVERDERDYNRRLREEQDAEYQRSLEADRERERQREAVTAAEEKARRDAQDAATRARAEQEAQKQRQATKESSIEARRQAKRATLGVEPAPGTSDAVQIRVRLPDGTNHQRRFFATEKFQTAYDFVDSVENLSTLTYSLASSYPRRVLAGEALEQSYKELGLAPQATLFVQPNDE